MSTPISISESARALPIASVADDVLLALHANNVVLHAEPGAGKSTGLPLWLLSKASPTRKILMLEPRRLAAIGVAERLADQLGESVGQRIGLRMRGQTKVSVQTVLEVVTEGVLTRILQADPTLEGIGLIIFDEFHERSLHADLGLALCREVQQALRADLRLLLMSATLDAVELSTGMGDLKQINCAGRSYPVSILWLGQSKQDLATRVVSAVLKALNEESGDVLVFLPGIAEIERAGQRIEPHLAGETILYRLHGRADAKVQRAATAPASPQQRRVILSTSIAETSITIDGVRVVIDSGLERRGRVDNSTGAQRLETVMASQASATQRAGRAGRTASGVCYRLWSESDHARRATSWQAEILRAELSPLLVELGQWGVADAYDLPWLDQPPPASLAQAENLLTRLGIWQSGRLSDYGVSVAQLPMHPRLGHMLTWAATHGVPELGCRLAVILEEGIATSKQVDIELQLKQKLPQHLERRIAQLLKHVKGNNRTDRKPSVAILLAQAYPDWIAQRRSGNESRFVLSCGAGAVMSSDDALAHSAWLSVASLGGSSRETRIFLAASLNLNELATWSPELFSSRKKLEWDDRQERVVAEQQRCLDQLVVDSKIIVDINDDEKAQALLSGIRRRGIACLPWTDECREWQARVTLISTLASDALTKKSLNQDGTVTEWPNVLNESLTENLEEWLLVWLQGKSSIKALAQLDLLSILQAKLSYQQQQELDALLPVRYTVPSGSKIKLRYTDGDRPVLSVKLQEMFGCQENPAVANGRIVLKVELLSPARRPVQLTTDLVNFWSNSYPAVKKDMAGRYPKHDWPDDPLSAKPTAYAKARKRK